MAQLFTALFSGSTSIFYGLLIFVLLYGTYVVLSFFYNIHKIGKIVDLLPGYKRHWLYGNLYLITGLNEEFLGFLQRQVKDFTYLSSFWFGPFRPNVVVFHPDTMKIVLKSTEPKQMTGGGGYSLFKPWLGDGLLLSSGDKWLRNRRLLTPAFHFDVLKPYVDIYNKSVDVLLNKLADEMDSSSHRNSSIEITQHVTMCTLSIIMKCAMSYEDDVQQKGISSPYVNSVFNFSRLVARRAMKPYLYNNTVYYLTGEGREFKKHLDCLHGVSERVIQQRKQELAECPDYKSKKHPDFLDILLLARDDDGKGLTDREIRDEVDTFMFEGHDTTSSAVSWVLYSLAGQPQHQTKCREELHNLVKNKNSETIEWSDLQSEGMTHLAKCIKEAMRIHSPVPWIGREVDQSITLQGVTLKPQTLIDISIYSLHHNPTVWGEDHNAFKPERFDSEAIEKMDSFSYLPFAAGPRNCIGQHFAMNEIKVVIGRILLRYELRVDGAHLVRHVPEAVMRAETGIKLFFAPVSN